MTRIFIKKTSKSDSKKVITERKIRKAENVQNGKSRKAENVQKVEGKFINDYVNRYEFTVV